MTGVQTCALPILQTNKFINLGKMTNFQFLKKEPVKKIAPVNIIPSEKNIDNIININLKNNENLTWEQFKKKRQPYIDKIKQSYTLHK